MKQRGVNFVSALYLILIATMGVATIVEKYEGSGYAAEHIYGSWWFALLWALLTLVGIGHFLRQRVRRLSTVALHLSFVLILAGALLTHLTAKKGIVYLRTGQTTSEYLTEEMLLKPLPFAITLDDFEVRYHEGTRAAADYVSHITMDDGETRRSMTVSMNNIASFHSIRLYQSSYDSDMQGSLLSMNSDPWGIPVTYAGYGLLFLSLVWMLLDPRGTYRRLLRSPQLRRGATLLLLLLATSLNGMAAPRTLPRETAEQFGKLLMVYNDRICPVQTYALDFTKKRYGKRTYEGCSAEQVLTGFIFFYDEWVNELDGEDAKADERRMVAEELHSGSPLKMLPYRDGKGVRWYAPTDPLPPTMDAEHQKYIREVFTRLNGEIQAGNYARANAFIGKMQEYQRTFGGNSLPSDRQVKAEYIYNKVAFATILFMVCLTMGVLSFLLLLAGKTRVTYHAQLVVLLLALVALSFCLALRWTITDNIPLANGYETMLFLAWSILLLTLIVGRWFPIMLTFGFLLSGFFLLVSHISQMDPQISHLMPVLNSPLLTLHVSIIMMAYALLSLTCVCGLTALLTRRRATELRLLSQLFLYPALTCLGLGIFIGAIWANVSWGTYWSWDPKETWALITFMVYAVGVHEHSLPFLRSTRLYHLYMVVAFLTLLMTYFGVNYFLGGMHSYA